MFIGLPNIASSFDYTNASWTLRCDIICEYVCLMLNYMEKRSIAHCAPRHTDASISREPWVDFSSSYFKRSMHLFLKQGSLSPRKLHQNYLKDIILLRYGKVDDGVL